MSDKREAAWEDACKDGDTVPPFVKRIHDYAASLWVRDACCRTQPAKLSQSTLMSMHMTGCTCMV